MENKIVDTILGTFIIEEYKNVDYAVATNLIDRDYYYHIPKGLSEMEIKTLFEEIKDLED